MAQLYEQEFKTQEKAKEERIKQAKEKALEEQRKLEEERKQKLERERQEAIDEARERERENSTSYSNNKAQNSNNTEIYIQTPEAPQQDSSSVIASNWSQVSPEQASEYMSARTGISVSTWQGVIFRESSNNPYALNSLGCFGYLQIMQSVHGDVSTWTPQAYLDKAVEIYQSSGAGAWEAW